MRILDLLPQFALALNSNCKLLYSILMLATKAMQLRAAQKKRESSISLPSQIPLQSALSPFCFSRNLLLPTNCGILLRCFSLPGALKINDCGQRSIWNEIGANTKNLYNGKCNTSKQGTSSEQKKDQKEQRKRNKMKRKTKHSKKRRWRRRRT